ncbi:hypothetical protein L208DRAFT_1405411 [Tricholoma matsutake]|nr:hypothetical protein L208DRAFT_1405411 [Tricholoma matsutake 945]
MSDRPRRSTRQPHKYQEFALATTVVTRPKRKAKDADPVDQLRFLLQNRKSPLTTMDISVRWTSISTGHTNCDHSQAFQPSDPLNKFRLPRIS